MPSPSTVGGRCLRSLVNLTAAAFGAKRLIFEDGYFAALNKPNVKHIEGRIASLHGHTVVLDDGREMSADYVVLCTGYDAEVG